MNSILDKVIFLVLLLMYQQLQISQGSIVIRVNTDVYLYLEESLSFQGAVDRCYAAFGHLPVITNEKQQLALEIALKNMSLTEAWLGMTEQSTEDALGWHWADGDRQSRYRSWARDQPNNHNGYQACAVMDDAEWWRYYDYKWNDEACFEQLGYICDVSTNITDCADAGFFKRSEGCYFITNVSKSWFEARTSCLELGGNLVTIRTASQQLELKTILDEHFNVFKYWIGLTRSIWSWRLTDAEAVYTKWGRDQPENKNTLCATVKRKQDTGGYEWDDKDCAGIVPALCDVSRPSIKDIHFDPNNELVGYFAPQNEIGSQNYANTYCGSYVTSGELATPHNSEEEALLRKVMEDNNWSNVWIGIREKRTPWTWIADGSVIRNQGCFWDIPDKRTMTLIESSATLTPNVCVNTCSNKNYQFAGLQGGQWCYCSNDAGFVTYGHPTPFSGRCATSCSGDDSKTCGGNNLNQVIAIHGLYTHWADDQPNNYDGYQGCAALDNAEELRNYDYGWNDERCHRKLGYICMKDDLSNCSGSAHFIINNKCYVVNTTSANWFKAQQSCTELGGNLATITSNEIQRQIRDILLNNFMNAEYWIGLYKGGWTTLNSVQTQYTHWADGEPNEREGRCVQLSKPHGYKWIDTDCTEKTNFICKVAVSRKGPTESSPVTPEMTKVVTIPVTLLSNEKTTQYTKEFNTKEITSKQAEETTSLDVEPTKSSPIMKLFTTAEFHNITQNNNFGSNVTAKTGNQTDMVGDLLLSTGIIAAMAVIGTIAFLAIIALLAYCFVVQKRRKEEARSQTTNTRPAVETREIATSTTTSISASEHDVVAMRKHSKSRKHSKRSRSSKTDSVDLDMVNENLAFAYKDSDNETLDSNDGILDTSYTNNSNQTHSPSDSDAVEIDVVGENHANVQLELQEIPSVSNINTNNNSVQASLPNGAIRDGATVIPEIVITDEDMQVLPGPSRETIDIVDREQFKDDNNSLDKYDSTLQLLAQENKSDKINEAQNSRRLYTSDLGNEKPGHRRTTSTMSTDSDDTIIEQDQTLSDTHGHFLSNVNMHAEMLDNLGASRKESISSAFDDNESFLSFRSDRVSRQQGHDTETDISMYETASSNYSDSDSIGNKSTIENDTDNITFDDTVRVSGFLDGVHDHHINA